MLLGGGVTGRDHFFSVSEGGVILIVLCGFPAGVSANVGEEFALSESGEYGVGCETF